ncbi:MAG: galactokinase [Ardenticatenaceae bacterium]|nr:galactokinase [Ardenticatenaceae bacterium]MCB9444877.1 galactokinase [Ardenticatenaceae bacterium]
MNLQQRVIEAFEQQFGERPSTIIRAPGRVNLIGEHTDYNDGFVLPMAIDRAVWLALRPRGDGRIHATSLEQTEPVDFALADIQHSGGWGEYVKGMAKMLLDSGHDLAGWESILTSDVPVGSGLSSSAALEMAVGCAFAVVSGFPFDGNQMARFGQRTENEWVGANTGIMDQMISANGQAGYALLIDCRDLATQPIPLPSGTAVLIMDTMTRHSHTESGYNERRQQCEAAAAYFEVSALRYVSITEFLAHETELELPIRKRARHVVTENLRTLNAVKAMRNNDAPLLGQLMNESHASLRDDFEVTNDELDIMARTAQAQPGCYGARMTGGGFGGCAVALVQADLMHDVAAAVATQYEAATGLKPQIFSTSAAAGTAVIQD